MTYEAAAEEIGKRLELKEEFKASIPEYIEALTMAKDALEKMPKYAELVSLLTDEESIPWDLVYAKIAEIEPFNPMPQIQDAPLPFK